MRELCARLRARRRAACGRASATVPARDGGRVPFLSSMAAAPLSLASTESGRLGPHRRAAQAELEHVAFCVTAELLDGGRRLEGLAYEDVCKLAVEI